MEGEGKDEEKEGSAKKEKQVRRLWPMHLDLGMQSLTSAYLFQVYGDYEIVRPIGKGKFAIVYRAQRISDGEIGNVVPCLLVPCCTQG